MVYKRIPSGGIQSDDQIARYKLAFTVAMGAIATKRTVGLF